MSIPTIVTVTPSSGPTAGRMLVEILGSGFRRPAPPAASGPVPAPPPTIDVFVGGRAARDVRVLGAERLTCVVPSGDAGAADVIVQNVDPDGAAIPGEQAIASQAFTYVRPMLTTEADLTRLVRGLLQELKRQVLPNVVLTRHTDFEDETAAELHLGEVAELPALVLMGPELAENRLYSLNQRPEHRPHTDEFTQRRVPYTVDLGFTVIGVADHTIELLSLMVATVSFFDRHQLLEFDRDPDDPAAGRVGYEMDIPRDGGFRVTTQPNESNVRSFSGRILLRGFDVEGIAGERVVARGAVTRELVLEQVLPVEGGTSAAAEPER